MNRKLTGTNTCHSFMARLLDREQLQTRLLAVAAARRDCKKRGAATGDTSLVSPWRLKRVGSLPAEALDRRTDVDCRFRLGESVAITFAGHDAAGYHVNCVPCQLRAIAKTEDAEVHVVLK